MCTLIHLALISLYIDLLTSYLIVLTFKRIVCSLTTAHRDEYWTIDVTIVEVVKHCIVKL